MGMTNVVATPNANGWSSHPVQNDGLPLRDASRFPTEPGQPRLAPSL